MDFRLSETQLALQDTARKFATGELVEVARRLEEEDEPVPLELRRRYGEMGFLGINVPEKYGGLGLSNLDAALVLEEFAKISIAVAFPVFESNVGPFKIIEHFGQEKLKQEVLPRTVTGEIMVAVSMSEPDAGTALTDLKTRGRIDGDRIILNGQKRWCSGGGHSDGYVVFCRLSDEPGARGIGAVYVERDRDGVSFGVPEKLMGWRGVRSSDIFLTDVEVPAHHLIVPAGGFAKLMGAFDLERCGNATMALGQASGALEDVLDYRYYVNGVPYVNRESGKREFLMPEFDTSGEGVNAMIFERNVSALESLGYKVIPVQTHVNEHHGGIHCMVNVIS